MRRTGCGVVMPFWLAVAAEIYGCAGQSEQALRLLAQSEDMMEKTSESWPEAEVIGCAAGSCSGCGTPRPPNRAFIVRSKWRGSKVPGSGNFALLSPLRASGAARTAGAKPMRCWRPFMVGSPRGLIYPT